MCSVLFQSNTDITQGCKLWSIEQQSTGRGASSLPLFRDTRANNKRRHFKAKQKHTSSSIKAIISSPSHSVYSLATPFRRSITTYLQLITHPRFRPGLVRGRNVPWRSLFELLPPPSPLRPTLILTLRPFFITERPGVRVTTRSVLFSNKAVSVFLSVLWF